MSSTVSRFIFTLMVAIYFLVTETESKYAMNTCMIPTLIIHKTILRSLPRDPVPDDKIVGVPDDGNIGVVYNITCDGSIGAQDILDDKSHILEQIDTLQEPVPPEEYDSHEETPTH